MSHASRLLAFMYSLRNLDSVLGLCFPGRHTHYELISTCIYSNKHPGVLQFRSPKNDVLKTKCGQIYQNFNVLKPICMAFGNLFPLKSGRGCLLVRGRLLE